MTPGPSLTQDWSAFRWIVANASRNGFGTAKTVSAGIGLGTRLACMSVGRYLRGGGTLVRNHIRTSVERTKPHRVRLRIEARERSDQLATTLGQLGTQVSTRLLLYPHRAETIRVPAPLEVGGRVFDVVDDLVAYTGLDRTLVESLIRREPDSFRAEWQMLPPRLRQDRWYYLSSRTYIFANAVHVHESTRLLDAIFELAPPPACILDFGGGTGNLALALAGRGYDVTYRELSALQKDFVRFRVAKHALESSFEILDDWSPLPHDRFDLVCALDVLEHLPDLKTELTERLLPSIRSGGHLLESSPFIRNLSNPMHHEDDVNLSMFLQERGFVLIRDDVGGRAWRRV